MRWWLPVWLCVLALLRAAMQEPEPPAPGRRFSSDGWRVEPPAAGAAFEFPGERLEKLIRAASGFYGAPVSETDWTRFGTAREIGPRVYEVTGWPTRRCTRLVPSGRGFKVACGYPGWGLEAGDVVLSVNGITFENPERVLASYDALQRARRFEVVIERAGRRITTVYLLSHGP